MRNFQEHINDKFNLKKNGNTWCIEQAENVKKNLIMTYTVLKFMDIWAV